MINQRKKIRNQLLVSDIIGEIKSLRKKEPSKETLDKLDSVLRRFLHQRYGLHEDLSVHEILTELNQKKIASEAKVEIPIALLKIHDLEFHHSNHIPSPEYKDIILQSMKAVSSTLAQI